MCFMAETQMFKFTDLHSSIEVCVMLLNLYTAMVSLAYILYIRI